MDVFMFCPLFNLLSILCHEYLVSVYTVYRAGQIRPELTIDNISFAIRMWVYMPSTFNLDEAVLKWTYAET